MSKKKYRIVIEAESAKSNDLPTRYEAWHVILEGYACVSGTPRRERSPLGANPACYALTVTAPPVDAKKWAQVVDIILYEEYGMPCAVTVEEEEEESGIDGIVG